MSLLPWCAALVAAVGAFFYQSERSASPPAPVVVVELHGELETSLEARIARGVREARATPGAMLIFDIDSPGGLVTLMGEMGASIEKASAEHSIPTAAFLSGGASGGAYSAGAFLALACDKIYMREGTGIGAALPVVPALIPGPGGANAPWDPVGPATYGIATADRESAGKLIKTISTRFRGAAERAHREPRIAEAFVDPSFGLAVVRIGGGPPVVRTFQELEDLRVAGEKVHIVREIRAADSGRVLALSASQAFELGFVDGVVENLADLLRVLGRDRAPTTAVGATGSEDFLGWLRAATPVLLLLGAVFGFLEAKIQGFGIAGVLSAVCFTLVFVGQYLMGVADWIESILFILGIGLLALEIFVVPGTIYCGAVGACLLATALLLSFQQFFIPRDSIDLMILTRNLAWGSGSFLGALVTMVLLSSALPHTPMLRRAVLAPPSAVEGTAAGARAEASIVGRVVAAATDLRPAGMIEIDGRRVDAVTVGSFVKRGTAVRIKEISGNRVIVVAEGMPA